VIVEPASTAVAGQMYVKPDHIYRNSSTVSADLMVVVHLPQGIGMEAIRTTPLVLTLEPVTGAGQRLLKPVSITGTNQLIFGSSTQGKVLSFFKAGPILAGTEGYGEFPLRVSGQLKDGRTFYALDTIWIVKFGGP
jgi:hypothetical protein